MPFRLRSRAQGGGDGIMDQLEAQAESAIGPDGPTKPPAVSKQLVEYLETLYPDVCPEPEVPEKGRFMITGAVLVVRHLRRLYEMQKDVNREPV